MSASKGDECPKCHNGEIIEEGLPNGMWLECNNCGSIMTVN